VLADLPVDMLTEPVDLAVESPEPRLTAPLITSLASEEAEAIDREPEAPLFVAPLANRIDPPVRSMDEPASPITDPAVVVPLSPAISPTDRERSPETAESESSLIDVPVPSIMAPLLPSVEVPVTIPSAPLTPSAALALATRTEPLAVCVEAPAPDVTEMLPPVNSVPAV
jgi:hypothetical protein